MLALFKVRPKPRLSAAVQALLKRRGVDVPAWAEVEALTGPPDVAPAIATEAAGLLASDEGLPAIADHAKVLRQASAAERLAFYALSRLLRPEAADRRARLLHELPHSASPLDGLMIDRRSGVLVMEQAGWAPVAEAVDEARALFARHRKRPAPVNPGKRFMTTAKAPSDLINSKIMALGMHPGLLRLVGGYLEGLPVLYRINLLESANEDLQADSSQFFHIDPEDFRQIKVFLLVEDVDADGGPLHLLRADASDEVRIRHRHRMGRLDDEAVMCAAPPGALVRCTGPAGTLAIGDTSRCFHFGSRPGARRRHVVMYQYLTPFAAAFPLEDEAITSKYAQGLRRAAEAGRPASELETWLLGLRR